jgi:hypothetical protein
MRLVLGFAAAPMPEAGGRYAIYVAAQGRKGQWKNVPRLLRPHLGAVHKSVKQILLHCTIR